jgi:hypothetical protein
MTASHRAVDDFGAVRSERLLALLLKEKPDAIRLGEAERTRLVNECRNGAVLDSCRQPGQEAVKKLKSLDDRMFGEVLRRGSFEQCVKRHISRSCGGEG